MPLLSIITATFNRASTLAQNFDSVRAQTFRDIEHIIVDNMSHDETATLVREYQRTAPYPVIYLREPDTGIYNALNKGLRRATGIWTHILHSDDRYASPSVLADIFARDLTAYDLIANAILVMDPARQGWARVWIPVYHPERKHFDFPHTGTILRKSFYDAHGYYDERYRIISDAVYNIQHYARARTLILATPLVSMNGAGISNKPSVRNLYESIVGAVAYHPFTAGQKAQSIAHYVYLFVAGKWLGVNRLARWRAKLARIPAWLRGKPRRRSISVDEQTLIAQKYLSGEILYPPGNSLITQIKYAADLYEPQLTRRLWQEVAHRRAEHFIDIGANIGLISLAMASRFPHLQIDAFEPGATQFRALQATVAHNRLGARWRVHQLALANANGTTTFFIHPAGNDPGDGLLDTGRAGTAIETTVPVMTLDTWWQSNGKPAVPVIKIDAEGAEGLILDGAREFLAVCQPTIFLEIWADNLRAYGQQPLDILKWLNSHGYDLWTLDDMLITPAITDPVWQLDASYLATPRQ